MQQNQTDQIRCYGCDTTTQLDWLNMTVTTHTLETYTGTHTHTHTHTHTQNICTHPQTNRHTPKHKHTDTNTHRLPVCKRPTTVHHLGTEKKRTPPPNITYNFMKSPPPPPPPPPSPKPPPNVTYNFMKSPPKSQSHQQTHTCSQPTSGMQSGWVTTRTMSSNGRREWHLISV